MTTVQNNPCELFSLRCVQGIHRTANLLNAHREECTFNLYDFAENIWFPEMSTPNIPNSPKKDVEDSTPFFGVDISGDFEGIRTSVAGSCLQPNTKHSLKKCLQNWTGFHVWSFFLWMCSSDLFVFCRELNRLHQTFGKTYKFFQNIPKSGL